jgi:hypothetical protein
MKKTVLALCAFIYLLFSSGMAFSVHYCMGERDTLKLGVTKTDICGRCGMDESEGLGCCRDEHLMVKLTQDQQTTQSVSLPLAPQPELVFFEISPFICASGIPDADRIIFADISPPPLLTSRNILYSNFRI